MAKRKSTKLIQLKNQARKKGWLKWLRQGAGEEADERALLNGCWFAPHRAQHFFDFIERYACLTEGAFDGKPFDLLDWQREFCGRIFGWVQESKEWRKVIRRFRTVYLEMPKKNGKTPLAATIGNYLFLGDSYGRQINLHTVATTRKQAERLLKHSTRQVRKHAELSGLVRVKKLEGFEQAEYGTSTWNVLAADPESADGVNGHIIADELHRWKGTEFYNTLLWALASQPEGMFVSVTTAGDDPLSVAKMLSDKTDWVNSGRMKDDSFFGVKYAASVVDDPHEEETWFNANPSLGNTPEAPLKLSTFRTDYESAKENPAEWTDWMRLRLGIWKANREGSWVDDFGGLHVWDAGDAARDLVDDRIDCYEDFSIEDLAGQPCFAGFDGAAIHDTTSLVFAFPDPDTDELIRLLTYFWLPRAEAELQSSRVPYKQWHEDGHIKLTDGDVIDFDVVYADAVELIDKLQPSLFYYDPLFQAEWFSQKIEDETGVPRAEFRQTIMQYSPPMKCAERLMCQHKLRHNGNPVMTWQLGNCQAKTDPNNNKRPVKRQKGDFRTIDGVPAMLMAIRDAVGHDPDSGQGWYEDNEVEFV